MNLLQMVMTIYITIIKSWTNLQYQTMRFLSCREVNITDFINNNVTGDYS